jgi:hypothetical protein
MLVLIGIYYHYIPLGFKSFPSFRVSHTLQRQAASSQYSIMSEERIGDKFLRKLYEKTVNNGIDSIERDEIGKEIE